MFPFAIRPCYSIVILTRCECSASAYGNSVWLTSITLSDTQQNPNIEDEQKIQKEWSDKGVDMDEIVMRMDDICES